MGAEADIHLRVAVKETQTGKGAAQLTSHLPHLLEVTANRASGTSNSQQDLVWSDRLTLSTSPTDIDLTALTSELDGSTDTIVEVTGIYIYNRSTTSGEDVQIGGDASAVGIFGAAADYAVLGPGGIFVWESPIFGVSVANSSTDILQLTAAAGTPAVDVVILGRSA